MKYMLALILLFSSQLHAEGISKWTDAAGKVHYGDRPPTEAPSKQVKISNNSATGGNSATSNGNSFYGMPIYPEKYKVEKTSSDTNATMRYMTPSPVATVVNFYQANIGTKYKMENAGGSTIFSYKIGEFNKMIEIQNFAGKADVTLLTEK
ncbi:MAG: DUF4124 domain-containing protein [Pseudomonadota bacterium]